MKYLNGLKSYINYEFSTGCTTGEDYKTFERKYINYLKSMCKEYGWEFVKANKNHYTFSAFIKNHQNKYVYLNIGDVRYLQNEWYSNILIRTAQDETDYHGGANNYTSLINLPIKIHELFRR